MSTPENSNKPLISICIPTYRRPEFLFEAVKSVVAQDYRPLEVVIGDDSPTPSAGDALELLGGSECVSVSYRHNTPSLGQAGNVNELFSRATGDYLVLLHDDDVLLPGALSAMMGPMLQSSNLLLVYGMQRLIHDDGTDLGDEAAKSLNETYCRTKNALGRQDSPVAAGLLRQIPNNGYLLDARKAREVGYRERDSVGDACDTDFGIRLGLALPPSSCLLISHETAAYRMSAESVLRNDSSLTNSFMYDLIDSLNVSQQDEQARLSSLASFARGAVREHANRGNWKRSWQILSRYRTHDFRARHQLQDVPWVVAPGLMRRLRSIVNRTG